MLLHQRIVAPQRDVAQVPGFGVRCHLEAQLVVRVQNRGVHRDLDHHALHLGELLECVDALQPQMIGADVEHRSHRALPITEPAAQDAAARGFEHRDLDVRIAQHHARRNRTGHVALHRELPVDIDAVGGREPDMPSRKTKDVREHARRGRLSVRSGDGRDRNARRRARREQHVDHRTCDIARCAFAGCHVHAEAGCRVDLADRTAAFLVGTRDVGMDEVDSADIEPDRLDRAHRHLGVVGMDDVGHIDRSAAGRKIAREPQADDFARRRNGCARVALVGQAAVGLRIEFETRQHLLVADAASRIVVRDLDEFGHRVRAIADDVPRHALGRRDQPSIDHEQPIVAPGDERLDDHGTARLARLAECLAHMRAVFQIERNTAAVIAVVGFHHDRKAELLRRERCLFLGVDQSLLWNRQAEISENAIGLLLVGSDLDRDVARLARDRRLDAALIARVPELNQALMIEADDRDVALFRRAHQRRRARPQRAALREADEVVALCFEVEVGRHRLGRLQLLGQQREQQQHAEPSRLLRDFRLLVLIDDVVMTGRPCPAGLAEGDLRPCDILQLDRDVLQHMPEPRPIVFGHTAHEPARLAVGAPVLAEPRQRFEQCVHVLGPQLHRRPLFEMTEIEREPDHREVGVDAGTEIDGGVDDLHRSGS